MKTKMTRVIAALLCLIMTLGILAGCQSGPDGDTNASETSNGPKPTLNVDGVGNDKYADYSVSGTVTIAVDTARATDYEALFDYMEVLFPNLEIQFDYFSHTTEDNAVEYLATRAAAGKLPDIVWDEAGMLPLYLTQGWLYPLDEFVKDDPDFAYIRRKPIRISSWSLMSSSARLKIRMPGCGWNSALRIPLPPSTPIKSRAQF